MPVWIFHEIPRTVDGVVDTGRPAKDQAGPRWHSMKSLELDVDRVICSIPAYFNLWHDYDYSLTMSRAVTSALNPNATALVVTG